MSYPMNYSHKISFHLAHEYHELFIGSIHELFIEYLVYELFMYYSLNCNYKTNSALIKAQIYTAQELWCA